jgi:hypothetical protein
LQIKSGLLLPGNCSGFRRFTGAATPSYPAVFSTKGENGLPRSLSILTNESLTRLYPFAAGEKPLIAQALF